MSISRDVLAKYVTKGCVFVETGCKWGDSCIRAAELGAASTSTCEVDPHMAGIAIDHLADALRDYPAEVHNVASVDFLRWKASGDIVFLDAHTENYSPVLEELAVIATWAKRPKVILIDDLRCMNAWKIKAKDLFNALQKIGQYAVTYEDGIVEKDIMVAIYK